MKVLKFYGGHQNMLQQLRALVTDDNGPTAIEYGLIAALVAVAIIAALILLGGALSNIFGYVGNTVNNSA